MRATLFHSDALYATHMYAAPPGCAFLHVLRCGVTEVRPPPAQRVEPRLSLVEPTLAVPV